MKEFDFMTKEKALEILEIALSTGGDFAEVFMENGSSEAFEMTLGKVSQISYRNVSGAAIRIIKGNTEVNTSVTDYSYENLKNAAKVLAESFDGVKTTDVLEFVSKEVETVCNPIRVSSSVASEEILLLTKASSAAMSAHEEIKQVICGLTRKLQNIFVFASDGTYQKDYRCNMRLSVNCIASDGVSMHSIGKTSGKAIGLEQYDTVDVEEFARGVALDAVEMLHADPMVGGEMPVVIDDIEGTRVLEERGVNGMIEEFNPFKIEEPNVDTAVSNFEKLAEPIVVSEPAMMQKPIDVFEMPTFSDKTESMNPGFMDINNIEENAKDIRVDVPVADMNSLLTPIELPKLEEEPVMPVEQPVAQNLDFSTNRFFSMPVEPVDINQPASVEPEKSVDELFQFNAQPIEPQVVEPQVSEATQNNVFGTELFDFNFDNKNNVPVSSVEQASVIESLPDFSNFQESVIPDAMNFGAGQMPTVDSLQNNNPMDTFTMQDSIPSAIPTPVISNQIPTNNRIIEALNIVRNCSKELENLGFSIDVEEIDFENLYQFIIKIQK